MGFLYKLTFPTGKSYVGLTTKPAISTRYLEHACFSRDMRRRSVLYNAWRKHGAPSVEILAEMPNEELAGAEIEAIAKHGALYPLGYNTTPGGDISPMHRADVALKVSLAKTGKKRGVVHSDESKAKLRAARLGAKMSDESRAKLSAAKKGKPSALKGRKLSDERKAACSAAQKASWAARRAANAHTV